MLKFLSKAFDSKKKKKAMKEKAKPKSPKNTDKDAPKTEGQIVAKTKNEDAAVKKTSTEREKLIENALAIHREKSKLLDSLPPAMRAKLTAMAMAIFIDQRSDNEKN
jgi:hypothetical protein